MIEVNKPMSIERIPYPKEEIEHLVSQILKLTNEKQNSSIYSHHIDEAIRVLTEMLGYLTKYVWEMKVIPND